MSTREVVTIQIGNYANYVGTHMWNLQRASFRFAEPPSASQNPTYSSIQNAQSPPQVNHAVLFRECGQMFTPRLIAIDLNQALGSYPRYGLLTQHDMLKQFEQSLPSQVQSTLKPTDNEKNGQSQLTPCKRERESPTSECNTSSEEHDSSHTDISSYFSGQTVVDAASVDSSVISDVNARTQATLTNVRSSHMDHEPLVLFTLQKPR